jgi:hypothetical protein
MSLREVQAVNIDPTGPVPPPDDEGRVVLNDTGSKPLVTGAVTFLWSAVALVSLLYWVITLESGRAPLIPNAVGGALLKFGVLALPALPFLFGALLSPPRLTLYAGGVRLRGPAGSTIMFWEELAEINLQERRARDRFGGFILRTDCRLFGGRKKLVIAPIFGVSPVQLAAYLQSRGQELGGGRVTVTQSPRPALPVQARVQLAVLAILALFAVALVLVAFAVMRHGPAAG